MTLDDSLIITAFGAMAGVIGVMWQRLSSEHAKLAERCDQCEKDRTKLFAELAELRGDSELLERCPAPACPLRPPPPTPSGHRPLVPVAP